MLVKLADPPGSLSAAKRWLTNPLESQYYCQERNKCTQKEVERHMETDGILQRTPILPQLPTIIDSLWQRTWQDRFTYCLRPGASGNLSTPFRFSFQPTIPIAPLFRAGFPGWIWPPFFGPRAGLLARPNVSFQIRIVFQWLSNSCHVRQVATTFWDFFLSLSLNLSLFLSFFLSHWSVQGERNDANIPVFPRRRRLI